MARSRVPDGPEVVELAGDRWAVERAPGRVTLHRLEPPPRPAPPPPRPPRPRSPKERAILATAARDRRLPPPAVAFLERLVDSDAVQEPCPLHDDDAPLVAPLEAAGYLRTMRTEGVSYAVAQAPPPRGRPVVARRR